MALLINELSLHGQFPEIAAFRDAIGRVMAMRQVARRFGREIYCGRALCLAQVSPQLIMSQAIRTLSKDEQRAVMLWLTRHGPFWEDNRVHGPDDYLECRGDIVTDSAVGEAAYCRFHGMDRRLISLAPSSWAFTPVSVAWVSGTDDRRKVDVTNHWDVERLELDLQAAPAPLASWTELEAVAKLRFSNLTFSGTCFAPLRGSPFSEGAAKRVLARLDVLHRFRACFDERGQLTQEGERLYQEHFAGSTAWFTDSSDTEKNKFRTQLTFPHPDGESQPLFCPWHGKVKTPQLRIHFSWPVAAGESLHVVYVGPKITKK